MIIGIILITFCMNMQLKGYIIASNVIDIKIHSENNIHPWQKENHPASLIQSGSNGYILHTLYRIGSEKSNIKNQKNLLSVLIAKKKIYNDKIQKISVW